MESELQDFTLSVLREAIDEELCPTITSRSQAEVEETVERRFQEFSQQLMVQPPFLRSAHITYLNTSLSTSRSSEALDCSRPWLCYWITHSLYLLHAEPSQQLKENIVTFLSKCQSPGGGFGGGPGQAAHLAPTFAALCCLATIATPSAFQLIDREKLSSFLWRIRRNDGSFQMHDGGEVDLRGIYCALVSAKLTNTYSDELFRGSADWITRCQTYEGGFAGCPGMEAHGGYSFCGIASLHLLDSRLKCDLNALLRWVVNKQMKYEGGFQGRTNKLVDVCYSFWQSTTAFLATIESDNDEATCLFSTEALQEYILICCQLVNGGFRDKPELPRDCYHTCYALSGLSITQMSPLDENITGSRYHSVPAVNPLYNIGLKGLQEMLAYFAK